MKNNNSMKINKLQFLFSFIFVFSRNGSAWTIHRQDEQAMPLNQTFNLIVVKQ
jgi:hypothetical protein